MGCVYRCEQLSQRAYQSRCCWGQTCRSYSTKVQTVCLEDSLKEWLTRAQAKKAEEEEAIREEEERSRKFNQNPWIVRCQMKDRFQKVKQHEEEELWPGATFHKEIYHDTGYHSRESRREQQDTILRAKDRTRKKDTQGSEVAVSLTNLKQLQESLAVLRNSAIEEELEAGVLGVFWKDGVLYHRWKLSGDVEDAWVDQIVLPEEDSTPCAYYPYGSPLWNEEDGSSGPHSIVMRQISAGAVRHASGLDNNQ